MQKDWNIWKSFKTSSALLSNDTDLLWKSLFLFLKQASFINLSNLWRFFQKTRRSLIKLYYLDFIWDAKFTFRISKNNLMIHKFGIKMSLINFNPKRKFFNYIYVYFGSFSILFIFLNLEVLNITWCKWLWNLLNQLNQKKLNKC